MKFNKGIKHLRPQVMVAAIAVAFSGHAASAALEEVIVTAQKRAQNLNDVSISVTAATAQDISDMRIETALDIAKLAPNVDIKSTLAGLNPAITVRGVGLNDFNVNNNPSVGVYVDEVFLTSPAMLSFMMFDVERVEVLKGPQGTLYGRNTNGGAINIVSVKPTSETEGYIRLGAGNFDSREVEAAIGGALSDNMSGRLSVRLDDRDGQHKWNQGNHTFGDIDSTAVRAQLAYDNGEGFNANLSVSVGDQTGTTIPGTSFGTLNADFGTCSGSQILAQQCTDFDGFTRTSSDPYKHDTDAASVALSKLLDVESSAVVLTANWDLGDMALTSITGVTDMERVWAEISVDHTPTITPYGTIEKDEDISQVSQEFRLSGGSDSFTWMVGAFYSSDEVETDNYIELTEVSAINDPELGLGGLDLAWGYLQETESMAVYGNTEFALNDKLTLVAGLRYSDETREFSNAGTYLAFDGTLLDADATFFGEDFDGALTPFTSQDDEISEDRVSGKLGLDYRANEDLLIYGSVSTGFKSGGYFGDFTFDSSELAPFGIEEVTAIEAGFKATMADGSAQLNGAIFNYDYEGIQTVIATDAGTFPLTNAEDATITGAELDLTWAPTESLDMRLAIGLLDHELEDARLGSAMPNAADMQATGLFRYRFMASDTLQIELQTDFKYTDEAFREAYNDPMLKTDSYTLWNGRVAVSNPNESWVLSVWGNNLTDEVYYPQGFDLQALNGTYMKFLGAQRTVGVNLHYSF